MKIKFSPFNLLSILGLALAARYVIVRQYAGSVVAVLFSLFGLITLPFRLGASLFAALGSGLTLRGWAAIEFEMWRFRRRGELFNRQQYMTYRRAYSPAISLRLVNVERQIIEGTGDHAFILIGGASQGKDIFLSGASLDDIRRPQR